MSYEESLRTITLDADATLAKFTGAPGTQGAATGANVAGNQYRAVMITGKHQAGLANAVTGPAIGILQNKPQNTGDASTIGVRGVSRMKVSTNIAAGALVYLAADGTGTNASGSNAIAIGTALDSTTTAGSLIPVLLKLGN
jgi:predicted RecA/RadA family phage recombinase